MRSSRMPTLNARLAALMVLFAAPVKGADEIVFERPEALQPAISFWTRVYSQADSLSGYVHDSSRLDIVYETLHFNWYDSAEVQDKRIAQAVQRYHDALQTLATGKRTDLTVREKKVLALWSSKAGAATLKCRCRATALSTRAVGPHSRRGDTCRRMGKTHSQDAA